MARLYWLSVAIVAAIAAHAAFVLYVPAYVFSSRIARMAADHGDNRFFILPPEAQAQLFPGLPRHGVTGICLFDVSRGDVTLSANLPDGFWITTIYTDKGEPIYSVNNRQSGSNVFAVSLSLAPDFIDMVIQATDKERPEIDSGWTVLSPEPRGLAVVWHPLTDAAQRAITAASMEQTQCNVAASAPSQ
jgi:uncharacterized membrane protein